MNPQKFFQKQDQDSFVFSRDDQVQRTKSVILREDTQDQMSRMETKDTIKLPVLVKTNSIIKKTAKLETNKTINNKTLNLKPRNRNDYITKMRIVGELNNEEEEFYETLTHFLDNTPCYVENKQTYNSNKLEKHRNMKSKRREQKIAGSIDKRFENLIQTLATVDTIN